MSFFCSRIPFRVAHYIQLSCLRCGFFVCFVLSYFLVLQGALGSSYIFPFPSPSISHFLQEFMSCNLRPLLASLEQPWYGGCIWNRRTMLYFSDIFSVFRQACVSMLWASQLFLSLLQWYRFSSYPILSGVVKFLNSAIAK